MQEKVCSPRWSAKPSVLLLYCWYLFSAFMLSFSLLCVIFALQFAFCCFVFCWVVGRCVVVWRQVIVHGVNSGGMGKRRCCIHCLCRLSALATIFVHCGQSFKLPYYWWSSSSSSYTAKSAWVRGRWFESGSDVTAAKQTFCPVQSLSIAKAGDESGKLGNCPKPYTPSSCNQCCRWWWRWRWWAWFCSWKEFVL